jgi:cell division protein FtsI (penicillin-binding protein 3)
MSGANDPGRVLEPGRGAQVRRGVLLAALLLAAGSVAVRAFQLEIVEGDAWLARAENQHSKQLPLPAPRGTIYDRNGVPLAGSRNAYRVAIAPREVQDRQALIARLQGDLGLSSAESRRVVAMERQWVVLPGRYGEAAREALDGVAGVHFERVMQRLYTQEGLASELLGAVNFEGEPLGGIELEFDTILAGRPGMATVRRDHRGRPLPGAMLKTVEPVAGRDVYLTIDANLQDIADAALRQAITETRSAGGELILLDPRTGEILAAVSRRGGESRNWRAVTEPYEPGSTIKPFLVASLLAERRATLADSVFAEHGTYVSGGRTLRDVHGYGWLTLAEALRVSSNIALAKLATRLDTGRQYAYLRDFGFGTPTAVTYPSESGGTLRRPARWSRYSQASLAIGYEISVTPLQMALAYGALANGGVLMEPRLVREVRSRDGRVEHTFEPRAVRRVVPEHVAAAIRPVLQEAVEAGTGRQAALGQFTLAGKTGTARIASGSGYRAGAYTASFAGFFPAEDPQLVFLVKIDEPEGAYYGGQAAAPVTRAAIEASLASRQSPIDRSAMATAAVQLPRPAAAQVAANGVRVAGAVLTVPGSRVRGETADRPYILAVRGGGAAADAAAADERVVPEVIGLPLRDAARLLHASGVSARIDGRGRVVSVTPAAGTRGASVVRVVAEDGQ